MQPTLRHVPPSTSLPSLEDSFSIRNSQIDAKISGEFGMSKLYDDEWNYSGEIEFIEGQIYYYLGDVFENLKGSMVFDGQGFNPFLELSASTKIGDAEILLGVFGAFIFRVIFAAITVQLLQYPILKVLGGALLTVSYTHLTLPTNREV